MMSAPLAARADIMSRMQSSIQLQTNSAATQVSRIGSTYAVSGSGVTMDVGGGNSADGVVGGLGTLTDGVGQGSVATATQTSAGGAFTFNQSFIALICFFVTDRSSSYLSKFSKRTFKDLGNFEIPVKPFFSASIKE